MNPYDPLSKCPKCGHNDASSRFVEGHEFEMPSGRVVVQPHISRNCHRCGFTRKEAPLDTLK